MRKLTPKRVVIPGVLPASPISLACPFCGAAPNRDCATGEGRFAVIHLQRIKAAVVKDKKRVVAARR